MHLAVPRLGRAVAALAVVAAIGVTLFSVAQALAHPNDGVDFIAAEPTSYDHSTGGGAYNDRTINVDVVETLNGGDYMCGDIVTFLPRFSSAAEANDDRTITMDFVFAATTTNGSEVGFGEIVNVEVNSAGTDGAGHDGNSVATLTATNGPIVGFSPDLTGTVQVTDVDAGEKIVVRVDVRLVCGDDPADASGVVQSQLTAAMVVGDDADSINVGRQTINLLDPGGIEDPNDPKLTIEKKAVDSGVTGYWDWDIAKWSTTKYESKATGPRPYGFNVVVESDGFVIEQWWTTWQVTLTNTGGDIVGGTLVDALEGFECTMTGDVEPNGVVGLHVNVPASTGETPGTATVDVRCVSDTDPGDGTVVNLATFILDEERQIQALARTMIDLTPPEGSPGQQVVLYDPMVDGGKKVLRRFDAIEGPRGGQVGYKAELDPPKKAGACWCHHNTAHLYDVRTKERVASSNRVQIRICRPKEAEVKPDGTVVAPSKPPISKGGVPLVKPTYGTTGTYAKYRTRLVTRVRAPKRVERGEVFKARVVTMNRTRRTAKGVMVVVRVPRGLQLATRSKGIKSHGRFVYWMAPKIAGKKRIARTVPLVAVKPGKRRLVARTAARNAKRSVARRTVLVTRPIVEKIPAPEVLPE